MKKILFIFLILAVVVLAGILVWQNWLKPAPVVNNQSIVSDETANWKVYTNSKYGFEFKYPSNMQIVSENDSHKTTFLNNVVYAYDDLTCGVAYNVSLENTSLPKINFLSVNKIPNLSFTLREKNCKLISEVPTSRNFRGSLPLNIKTIVSELQNKGISDQQLSWSLFDNAVDYTGNFYCQEINIDNINNSFWVDSINCSNGEGVTYLTRNISMVPKGREDFVAEFTDYASQYGDVFDKIVATFKFTK